jgi:hypothetical protein
LRHADGEEELDERISSKEGLMRGPWQKEEANQMMYVDSRVRRMGAHVLDKG